MESGRRTSVGVRPQHVPGAAHRVEQPRVPRAVDLAAQVADVDVHDVALGVEVQSPHVLGEHRTREDASGIAQEVLEERVLARGELDAPAAADRKSTRLNSSHGYISYAVFCLKKKKMKNYNTTQELQHAAVQLDL